MPTETDARATPDDEALARDPKTTVAAEGVGAETRHGAAEEQSAEHTAEGSDGKCEGEEAATEPDPGAAPVVPPAVSRALPRAAWLAPLGLFALVGLLLGPWLIDDAGLSFAYARSLAHFDGLVSQPGRAPVEGFSNPLWVLALAPFWLVRLFHPVLVSKLLGLAAAGGGLYLAGRALARRTGRAWPAAVLGVAWAGSAPLVIWTFSGLENGLTLLCAAGAWAVLTERRPHHERWAGVLAGLAAWTRPDGLALTFGALAAYKLDALARGRSVREIASGALRFVSTAGPIVGVLFGLRLALFGKPWPQTYYAKREFLTAAERAAALWSSPDALTKKLTELGTGAAGAAGPTLLALGFAAGLALVVMGRARSMLRLALVLQASAIAAFVWLEDDWMGETRFGTAAIALTWIAWLSTLSGVRGRTRDRALSLAWGAVGAASLAVGVPRVVRFASNPPTPYADVERASARFDAYAKALGLTDGSLLTPDVGAALVGSSLRIYDAAGLVEPDVIRTIKGDGVVWRFDHPAFDEWVFETAKPTFVRTRKFWSAVGAYDHDPRFRRDYVAIDAWDDEYALRTYGRKVRAGEFVRRDALARGGAGALERLRAAAPKDPRPDPWVDAVASWFGVVDPAVGATLSPDAAQGQARALQAAGDPDRAAALLSRALTKNPGEVNLLGALALALDDAGRPDEARRALREVQSLGRPEAHGPWLALAQTRLGDDAAPAGAAEWMAGRMNEAVRLLHVAGDPARAEAILREVLSFEPSHYGARYQLAVALDRQNRGAEATKEWATVLQAAARIGDEATLRTASERLGLGAAPAPQGVPAPPNGAGSASGAPPPPPLPAPGAPPSAGPPRRSPGTAPLPSPR